MTHHDLTLQARGVTKRFGTRTAVADLTLRIEPGRVYGLLGPNGAGKTTSVRLLTGLIAPTSGEVSLGGEALTARAADRLRGRIGVQTDTEVYAGLTVRENLRTWGELYGVPSRALAGRIDEVLHMLALADRADSRAGELSTGMRQKLAVGSAVLHRPAVLFLDEPTAGLDPEAAADLIDDVRAQTRERGMTVVITTHQLHGLEALCDDLGILSDGRLVASGTVADLIAQRWPGRRYLLDVGDVDAASAGILALTGRPPEHADGMLRVALPDDTAVSDVVAALVRDGVPISAVVPLEPTVSELYFAAVQEARPA